jgi:hypothetical protein
MLCKKVARGIECILLKHSTPRAPRTQHETLHPSFRVNPTFLIS